MPDEIWIVLWCWQGNHNVKLFRTESAAWQGARTWALEHACDYWDADTKLINAMTGDWSKEESLQIVVDLIQAETDQEICAAIGRFEHYDEEQVIDVFPVPIPKGA